MNHLLQNIRARISLHPFVTQARDEYIWINTILDVHHWQPSLSILSLYDWGKGFKRLRSLYWMQLSWRWYKAKYGYVVQKSSLWKIQKVRWWQHGYQRQDMPYYLSWTLRIDQMCQRRKKIKYSHLTYFCSFLIGGEKWRNVQTKGIRTWNRFHEML